MTVICLSSDPCPHCKMPPPQPDTRSRLTRRSVCWKRGRADYCAGLERRWPQTARGFESRRFRQLGAIAALRVRARRHFGARMLFEVHPTVVIILLSLLPAYVTGANRSRQSISTDWILALASFVGRADTCGRMVLFRPGASCSCGHARGELVEQSDPAIGLGAVGAVLDGDPRPSRLVRARGAHHHRCQHLVANPATPRFNLGSRGNVLISMDAICDLLKCAARRFHMGSTASGASVREGRRILRRGRHPSGPGDARPVTVCGAQRSGRVAESGLWHRPAKAVAGIPRPRVRIPPFPPFPRPRRLRRSRRMGPLWSQWLTAGVAWRHRPHRYPSAFCDEQRTSHGRAPRSVAFEAAAEASTAT